MLNFEVVPWSLLNFIFLRKKESESQVLYHDWCRLDVKPGLTSCQVYCLLVRQEHQACLYCVLTVYLTEKENKSPSPQGAPPDMEEIRQTLEKETKYAQQIQSLLALTGSGMGVGGGKRTWEVVLDLSSHVFAWHHLQIQAFSLTPSQFSFPDPESGCLTYYPN